MLRACIGTLLFLLGLSSAELSAETSPAEPVMAFYSADLNGVRLERETYNAHLQSLTTWEHEPGWDTVFVTKAAHIYKVENLTEDRAKVEVRYDVVGILESSERLLQIEFNEVIDFSLIKAAGGWKISGPIPYPHVTPNALSAHLERIINRIKQNEERVRDLVRLRDLLIEMK
jgi:hypothetical protein